MAEIRIPIIIIISHFVGFVLFTAVHDILWARESCQNVTSVEKKASYTHNSRYPPQSFFGDMFQAALSRCSDLFSWSKVALWELWRRSCDRFRRPQNSILAIFFVAK